MKRLISLAALFVPTAAFAHDGLEPHAHIGQAIVGLGSLGVLLVAVSLYVIIKCKRAQDRTGK